MKKTIIVMFIAAIAFAGYCVPANAAVNNAAVPLTVTVGDVFGFDLSAWAVDFGNVEAGGYVETTIDITCKTNQGSLWQVTFGADPLSDGTNMIPNESLIQAGWSNDSPEKATGTFPSNGGPLGAPMPIPGATFYLSGTGEEVDSYVPLNMGLYLTIPVGQAKATYTTDLMLTMTVR